MNLTEAIADLVGFREVAGQLVGGRLVDHDLIVAGRQELLGEDGGVGRVLAGRQGDSEEVFAAVDAEAGAGRARDDARRGGGRGAGEGGGRGEKNRDAREGVVVPGDGGGSVDPEEDGLAAEGGEEVAEAGAVELDDFRRGLGAGPALEEDEGRDEFGRRSSGGEIEVHFDRDGVARGGGGEVGWEVKTEHGCGAKNFRE